MTVKQKRGPGRPPAGSRRVDTRERLLNGAAKVFARHGYRGASVEQVIKAARLSKGTFYWHFKSKEELFFALLDDRIDRPIREYLDRLATAPPQEDMSAAVGGVLAEVLGRDREIVLLDYEYWAMAARDPRVRAAYVRRRHALLDAMATALEARRRQLGAPEFSTPPEETATAFLALIEGISMTQLTDPESVPEHLLGDTFAQVYAGLVARAEG